MEPIIKYILENMNQPTNNQLITNNQSINFREHKVKYNNIKTIVGKINKLVQIYLMKNELNEFLYTVKFKFIYENQNILINKYYCDLFLFNYEIAFHKANLDKVYINSPFNCNRNDMTMRKAIENFLKVHYPEYVEIENFINKMLYSYPDELKEDDFKKLNDLYSEIKLKD